jgi:hypothetical protein
MWSVFESVFFLSWVIVKKWRLDLHLLKTVLPDGSVRGDTVFTEVDEDVHAVGVHGLVHEDIVVVVVAEDLLDGGSSAGLEFLDGVIRGTLFLELVVDGLDVGCVMS